ncbi:MAG: DUF4476 domain-containing protein [Ferruginibacter sp.]
MRFFNYLVFSFLFSVNAGAQQTHYIYIQTENKQAFYVKLNEKIFSSTASGYTIIPKLTDGKYKLIIGFPKNEWSVQAIEITIKDNDEGFLLKYFDSKVWGLFNLQTLAIEFATDAATISKPEIENKTDAFSNTLAEVTDTPSLRQQESVKEQLTNNSNDSASAIVKEKTAAIVPTTHISEVFSMIDSTGRSVIYAINDGNNNDSVRIFIPYDKNAQTIVEPETKTWGEIRAITRDSLEKKDSIVNTLQPVNNEIQQMVDDKPIITNVKVADANADKKNEYKVTIINPACKAIANVDDLSRLGKKIAAAVNDDARIAAAKKVFKTKCFTAEQVRNLAPLFSNDEGKYNFFDAAYSHVTDIGNFKDLQFQLTDEYYITRFKAMIR